MIPASTDIDLDVDDGTGEFYRHVVDMRLGDIDVLGGKLKLVLIGSYQHGGNFRYRTLDDPEGYGRAG